MSPGRGDGTYPRELLSNYIFLFPPFRWQEIGLGCLLLFSGLEVADLAQRGLAAEGELARRQLLSITLPPK